MTYTARHIRKLQSKAGACFEQLQRAFPAPSGDDTVSINGAEVRMAVDDFKVILDEIRRLK